MVFLLREHVGWVKRSADPTRLARHPRLCWVLPRLSPGSTQPTYHLFRFLAPTAQHRPDDGVAEAGGDRARQRLCERLAVALAPAGAAAHQDAAPAVLTGLLGGGALLQELVGRLAVHRLLVLAVDRA